jgi:hypothetical protein
MTQLNSALFIDYDNVRTELDRFDPAIGARFSNKTLLWLEALERHLPLPDGLAADSRRIVSRRCYASPHKINSYRRGFTQAGFEVVDCPPLTSHLKNSADIYIVMDVIDYLQRYPHIDEYIILSADADFVPVLNRLRKELKKSVIFTSYNTTAAYRNCADRTIEADFFSSHLAAETVAPLAAQEIARSDGGDRPLPVAVVLPEPPGGLAAVPPAVIDEVVLEQIEDCLIRAAERRKGLLPFATAAQTLRLEMPAVFGGGWAGYRTFTALLEQLQLSRLGRNFRRHELLLPEVLADLRHWPAADREALNGFVADVALSAKKSIPLLPPEEFSLVFDELARYYRQEAPETLTHCVDAIAATCAARQLSATPADIRFIAIGISMQQYRFEEGKDAAELAALWRLQVYYLCGEPEWMREPEQARLLGAWFHASGEPVDAARDDFLARTADEEPRVGDTAAA